MNNKFPLLIQLFVSAIIVALIRLSLSNLKLSDNTLLYALLYVVVFLLLVNFLLTDKLLCKSPLKLCNKKLPVTTAKITKKLNNQLSINKNNNNKNNNNKNNNNNNKNNNNKNKNNNKNDNQNKINKHKTNLQKIHNYRKQLDKLSTQELEELNGPQLKRILDSLEMNIKGYLKDANLNKLQYTSNNKETPGLYVENDVFPDSVKQFHDLSIPVMGPFDEISQEEYQDRLNYLYYATQHPYKNVSYRDYKSASDKRLLNDKSSLIKGDKSEFNIEMERWYPSMSINQVNYRDCTNHENSELSCLQPHPNKQDNILNNSKDNSNKEEKFASVSSMPKSLVNNQIPILFKNTDTNNEDILKDNEYPRDISNDLCAHCTVGTCWKGICGSRIFEDGSHNIVGTDELINSYKLDNVPLQ